MAGQASLDPAAYTARWPLTLPSVCENRCTPRWKRPYRAWPLVPALFGAFLILSGVLFLVFRFIGGLDSADLPAGVLLFLVFLLGAILVALPGVLLLRRPGKVLRHIVAGERVPVSVYYARTNEPNPTVARRPHGRSPSPEDRQRAQPLLLLAATDGRMWTATPDIATFWNQNPRKAYALVRNNPWIAPLHALVYPNGAPAFDQDTLARRQLPVDLQAPAQERVRAALAPLGEPSHNDPRFVGGPVPGEILMSPSGRRFRTTYGRPVIGGLVVIGGLILHRPADAPAQASLNGPGWFEHLFFGTDPGLCCGLYLGELTPHQASW